MFRKPKITSLISSIKENKISPDIDVDEKKNTSLKKNETKSVMTKFIYDNDLFSMNDKNLSTSDLIKLVYKEKEVRKRKFVSREKEKSRSLFLGFEIKSSSREATLTQKENSTLKNPKENGIKVPSKGKIFIKTRNNTYIYKGMNKTPNKFLAGPIQAPTNIRTTCRFDYQPDICKDYKETGFCGYGDTCIYMHDRGDFLTGWQLENCWYEKKIEEEEKRVKEIEKFNNAIMDGKPKSDDYSIDYELENIKDQIPFACYFCRDVFKDPVVTICQHYFCHACVMMEAKNKKSMLCPICKRDTNNIFNYPFKLVAKKKRVVGPNGTWQEYKNKLLK